MGLTKAGIGNMRKAYQYFWGKLLGRSWDSIACIVLWAEQIRFEFLAGETGFFWSPKHPHCPIWPTQSLIQWVPGAKVTRTWSWSLTSI